MIDDKSIYKLVFKKDEKPYASTIKKNLEKLPKQSGDPSQNGEPLYLSPIQWEANRSGSDP
jgi:predicted RecA/RadA family phage recombinase